MSRSATQAKVAALKERRPELYCSVSGCLWRVVTSRGPNPCQKHLQRFALVADAEKRAAQHAAMWPAPVPMTVEAAEAVLGINPTYLADPVRRARYEAFHRLAQPGAKP